jgi:hypothetical protein
MCCWTQPSLPHRRGWEDLATIILYSHVNWDDEEMKRKEAE